MNINLKARQACLVLLLVASQSSWPQDGPHWSSSTCQACHADASPVAGAVSLVDGLEAEALCESCHGGRGDALPCRHQSNLVVEANDVDQHFRSSLKDGKIVCTTCHDIVYQCKRPKAYYSFDNPGFLRDRGTDDSGEYCLRCHESEGIKRLDPHGGVAGTPPRATCPLCHQSIPAASATGELNVTFNMQADLSDTCLGCHVVRSHPKGYFTRGPNVEWAHLVAPSANMLQRMRDVAAETGVSLPLEPGTGRINCATCHNPHSFKMSGGNGAQHAPTKGRLRLDNICRACHDK